MLEKLLGLMSLGSSFASLTILHRFLAQLAVVLALVLISAVMGGALILAALYGLYATLVYEGLTQFAAIMLVSVLAILLITLFISLTVRELNKLRRIPTSGLHAKFPGMFSLSGMAEAFMDGLLNRSHPGRE